MTVGSTGSEPADAAGPTSIGSPGVDVVDQALQVMFGGAANESAAEVEVATQAALDAIDLLVVDALNACLAESPDMMASLIATIAKQHTREGVSRAINVLGAVIAHRWGCLGQTGEDVELAAPNHVGHTAAERMVMVRSARLASEFTTATRTHDGVRLATTLRDMEPENFEPVMSILVTYAAGLLDDASDVQTQVETAIGRQLCPTQT